MALDHKGAFLYTGDGTGNMPGITGSFSKLHIVSGTANLYNIDFGNLTNPESGFTPTDTIAGPLHVGPGTTIGSTSVIEGPIARFAATGSYPCQILVYYR